MTNVPADTPLFSDMEYQTGLCISVGAGLYVLQNVTVSSTVQFPQLFFNFQSDMGFQTFFIVSLQFWDCGFDAQLKIT